MATVSRAPVSVAPAPAPAAPKPSASVPAPAPRPAVVPPPASSHAVLASVAPPPAASSVHPASIPVVVASVPASTPAPTSHALSTTPRPSSSSRTSVASSIQTGTNANATSSSVRHGIKPGYIAVAAVAGGIVLLIVLVVIRRCARRKPSRDFPPPNNNFFQPYWGPHSGVAGAREEENGMRELNATAPWLTSHSSAPSETNSWRKSLGESKEVVDLDSVILSPARTASGSGSAPGRGLARSPLGSSTTDDSGPLVPPAAVSNPFLSSSPATSSTSVNGPFSPISPDPSSYTTDGLLAAFPPSPDDATSPPTHHDPDFFPTAGPRPSTNSSRQTPTKHRTTDQISSSASRRQSRQSLYSLASGYSPSYYNAGDNRMSMRGTVPHRSNMQIVLPEPLAASQNLSADPSGSSTYLPTSIAASKSLNRRSRVDMWAETLTRAHSPRPTSIGHEAIVDYNRKRRKSGESLGSNGDAASDRPRSRNTPTHFVHPEDPPPLPYLQQGQFSTNSSRAGTPGSAPGLPSPPRSVASHQNPIADESTYVSATDP